MNQTKYIIIYRYSDDVFYINVSYSICESLGDVENCIARLKGKYEIQWLKVFPLSSELTEYRINNKE